MSNQISSAVPVPGATDIVMANEYLHQLAGIKRTGVWQNVIVPALTRQHVQWLEAVRAHVSADPEAGAAMSNANGILDGIEATLDLFGIEKKLTDRIEELALKNG